MVKLHVKNDEKNCYNMYDNIIEFLLNENNFCYNQIKQIQFLLNENNYDDDICNQIQNNIQIYYDILKMNNDLLNVVNEKYNNEIYAIIRFDCNIMIVLNDFIVHSYMIYDDVDENNIECYTLLFECDNIEKYNNFDEFLREYDLIVSRETL